MKKVMEFRAQARLCRQLYASQRTEFIGLQKQRGGRASHRMRFPPTTKNATSFSCVMQLPARMLWLEQSDLREQARKADPKHCVAVGG